jgi:hypothetical protein
MPIALGLGTGLNHIYSGASGPNFSTVAYRAATSGKSGAVVHDVNHDPFSLIGTSTHTAGALTLSANYNDIDGFVGTYGVAYVTFDNIPAWTVLSSATLRLRALSHATSSTPRSIYGWKDSAPGTPANNDDWVTAPPITVAVQQVTTANTTYTLDVKVILEELAATVGWNFPASIRFVMYPLFEIGGSPWGGPNNATDAYRPELTITAAL